MDRALLKCSGTHEQVSVNNHKYHVVDGFVFIDVRPLLTAPRFIPNPDPFGAEKMVPNSLCDPIADAELDATEICRLMTIETEFGVSRRFRIFEPPTKAERDAWLAVPANLAAWEGISKSAARKAIAAAPKLPQPEAEEDYDDGDDGEDDTDGDGGGDTGGGAGGGTGGSGGTAANG